MLWAGLSSSGIQARQKVSQRLANRDTELRANSVLCPYANEKLTDTQVNKQTDRQTDRWTDRQTGKHIDISMPSTGGGGGGAEPESGRGRAEPESGRGEGGAGAGERQRAGSERGRERAREGEVMLLQNFFFLLFISGATGKSQRSTGRSRSTGWRPLFYFFQL